MSSCCSRVTRTQCHCGGSGCHQTFATLTSFDDHLVHAPGSAVVTGCLHPRELGLVADDFGVWRTPAGLARRNLDKERLASLRQVAPGSPAGRP